MTEITYKRCGKCHEPKPTTPEYFHRQSDSPDGLKSQCKDCIKVYGQENRPAARERWTRWIKGNPERSYHITHPEESRQVSQNWKDANREQVREANRGWRKKSPEKAKAVAHRRNARIKGNGGSFTAEEWIELCERYDNRCLCCGEQKPLTVDHVVPISKGGSNSIDNIQPLCLDCNMGKGVKTIDYRP